MKRMLFNATQEEELRVAMVDGQRLYDLNIELPASERKKANIYKGTITRIEPSLEAAFVNYGAERHGFLPLKEISGEYFVAEHSGGKPNIREVLKEGQDIVVQIDKEERGNKGAALTTFVSLAGRFIVLKPNKDRSGGVSRRIVGEDRDLARQSLKEVNVPDGMSVILRTAGIDRSAEELEWDLNNLLAIWEAIKTVVVRRTSPFLIYRESDSVVRALRDYLTNEIGEILIDDQKAHDDAKEFIEQVMPHNLRKLKHYQDPVPLFTRYQIESQIESAFAHQVTLPSGGSVVIDHTEALVSIDINSARATKGGDIEATALQTNLEAADEIGRQLRLRDLGGLIVIDFIDMGPQKHQREVEAKLREAVRQDRARVQIGKISRFGLLEMSRQRLRPSLGESSYLTCPRCNGMGTIRSVESLALAILRIIGEEARKERTAKVIAQLPAEVATYLLNEKRDWVQNVEARNETQVVLVANPNLETPHYDIRRVRDDQTDLPENSGTSYELAQPEEEQIIPQAIQPKPVETPAIAATVATTPAPKRKVAEPKKAPGFLAKLVGMFSTEEEEETPAPRKKRAARKPRKASEGRSRGGQKTRRRSSSKSSESRSASGKKKTKAKKTKTRGKKTDSRAEKPRSERQNQEASQSAKDSANKHTTAKDEGDKEERTTRRRSRGGRRRRRSKDSSADAKPETAANETQTATSDATTAEKKPPRRKPSEESAATEKPSPSARTAEPAEQKRSDSTSTDSAQSPKPAKSEPSAAPKRDSGDTKPQGSESSAPKQSRSSRSRRESRDGDAKRAQPARAASDQDS
ncbi:MAG: Rne/Rng family ribonuclease [Pseudomonadota bacterium]